MAAIDDVKAALRITHSDDDTLLTRLINSALREYQAYINATILPVDDDAAVATYIPEDAFNGVVLMVSADYENDPEKRPALRAAAEGLWTPYREEFGV